jgi:hypothetical protein
VPPGAKKKVPAAPAGTRERMEWKTDEELDFRRREEGGSFTCIETHNPIRFPLPCRPGEPALSHRFGCLHPVTRGPDHLCRGNLRREAAGRLPDPVQFIDPGFSEQEPAGGAGRRETRPGRSTVELQRSSGRRGRIALGQIRGPAVSRPSRWICARRRGENRSRRLPCPTDPSFLSTERRRRFSRNCGRPGINDPATSIR